MTQRTKPALNRAIARYLRKVLAVRSCHVTLVIQTMPRRKRSLVSRHSSNLIVFSSATRKQLLVVAFGFNLTDRSQGVGRAAAR